MKKDIIIYFMSGFCLVCLLFLIMFMAICKDLLKEVNTYRYLIKQGNYICENYYSGTNNWLKK